MSTRQSFSRADTSGPRVTAGQAHAAALLLSFNWLPAAHAHPDWLDESPETLCRRSSGQDLSVRLLRDASALLLDRYRLRTRFVPDDLSRPWLFWPVEAAERAEETLGTAMLGAWVRDAIDRAQVALQMSCLDTEGRSLALQLAASAPSLAEAVAPADLPAHIGPQLVRRLGRSCLSALLDDPSEGARERFDMRFPRGEIIPLVLSASQRSDAFQLLASVASAATPVDPETLASRASHRLRPSPSPVRPIDPSHAIGVSA